jgi:hypothetical protein
VNLPDAIDAAVRRLVGEALASAPRGITGFQAEVVAVTAGVATIRWAGSEFTAARLASYTPVVGELVEVLLIGTDPVIQGRVVGTTT